jgi:hypothetical protein
MYYQPTSTCAVRVSTSCVPRLVQCHPLPVQGDGGPSSGTTAGATRHRSWSSPTLPSMPRAHTAGPLPPNHQFYLVNCSLSPTSSTAHRLRLYRQGARPLSVGTGTYYWGCTREGGHSGWLPTTSRRPRLACLSCHHRQVDLQRQMGSRGPHPRLWKALAYGSCRSRGL